MVDEMGFEPPTSSLRTVGKISSGKAPQSLSYFHGALNWQTWQTGFLFVFSVQFDGEKPDKITRGASACNDDKVIFENPLNWTIRSFFREEGGARTWASHSHLSQEVDQRPRFRSCRSSLLPESLVVSWPVSICIYMVTRNQIAFKYANAFQFGRLRFFKNVG